MYKLCFVVVITLLGFACVGVLARPQGADADAVILNYVNEISPEGSYNYEYETSNKIEASEQGVGSSYASGSYSYTAPDGQLISVTYTADENGYHPKGAHLPTPPPTPDYILKALKYIEEHPFPKSALAKKK